MVVTQVGRRGQITVPRAVRKQLDIQEGDKIAFVQGKGGIVLQPLTETLLEHRGSVPVAGPQDLTTVRRQVLKARAERIARGDNDS